MDDTYMYLSAGGDPVCAVAGCNGVDSRLDSESADDAINTSAPMRYLQVLPYLQHLLCPNPLPHSKLWAVFKKAAFTYWVVDYIDPSADTTDWTRRLNTTEQRVIAYLLSLLATAKGIHYDTVWRYFAVESRLMETRYFFGIQMVMENTHMECCSRFLWSFVKGEEQRQRILEDLKALPYVRERTAWVSRWIDNLETPYHLRLVAFAASQAISFSGTFAVLLWIEDRGLLPSLARCNRLMAVDGGVLIRYAQELASLLPNRPCQHIAEDAIVGAAEIEKRFMSQSLSLSSVGLAERDMSSFVEYTADRLLATFGYEKKYHASNPFPFAQFKSIHSGDDFFALREPAVEVHADPPSPPPGFDAQFDPNSPSHWELVSSRDCDGPAEASVGQIL